MTLNVEWGNGMSQPASAASAQDLTIVARVRQVLTDHGRLAVDVATLGDESDLYQAGMTSHASVNVMLALEGEFDVEFPDSMLKRSAFESIAAIAAGVQELTGH